MPPSLIIDTIVNTQDIVICDSVMALQAHQGLFSLKKDSYIILPLKNIDSLPLLNGDNKTDESAFLTDVLKIFHLLSLLPSARLLNMHFVVAWEHMLDIIFWAKHITDEKDVFNLIPFANLDGGESLEINHFNSHLIFDYLLSNKRFDIFRRVCHCAREQVMNRLENKSIHVVIHLFSPVTKTIVASSL